MKTKTILAAILLVGSAAVPLSGAYAGKLIKQNVTKFDDFGNRISKTRFAKIDDFGNRTVGMRVTKVDAFGNRVSKVTVVKSGGFGGFGGSRIIRTSVSRDF